MLPDVSTTYYVHPTLRVTTDADLRDARTLGSMSRALGLGTGYEGGYGRGGGAGRNAGMELWVRQVQNKAGGRRVHWGNGSAGASVKGKGKVNGNGNANANANAHGKGKGKWRGNLEDVGLARWWVDHEKREVSAADDVVGLEDRESSFPFGLDSIY